VVWPRRVKNPASYSQSGARVHRAGAHLAKAVPVPSRRPREALLLLACGIGHQAVGHQRWHATKPRPDVADQALHGAGDAGGLSEQDVEGGDEGGGVLQEAETAGQVSAARRTAQDQERPEGVDIDPVEPL